MDTEARHHRAGRVCYRTLRRYRPGVIGREERPDCASYSEFATLPRREQRQQSRVPGFDDENRTRQAQCCDPWNTARPKLLQHVARRTKTAVTAKLEAAQESTYTKLPSTDHPGCPTLAVIAMMITVLAIRKTVSANAAQRNQFRASLPPPNAPCASIRSAI
jgi:hypothetical protein